MICVFSQWSGSSWEGVLSYKFRGSYFQNDMSSRKTYRRSAIFEQAEVKSDTPFQKFRLKQQLRSTRVCFLLIKGLSFWIWLSATTYLAKHLFNGWATHAKHHRLCTFLELVTREESEALSTLRVSWYTKIFRPICRISADQSFFAKGRNYLRSRNYLSCSE